MECGGEVAFRLQSDNKVQATVTPGDHMEG
jgi:hypothetical protein